MASIVPCTSLDNNESKNSENITVFWVETPRGKTICTSVARGSSLSYDALLGHLWGAALSRNVGSNDSDDDGRRLRRRTTLLVHDGKVVNDASYGRLLTKRECFVSLRLRLLGGIDRQNRVGSKFGGGGVSSSQHAERERKERLRQLALESIDLAKDPYLMKNHLGSYECKLCLTLHTNEANYLAHTQGKKHQAGLARRAHMEKLRQEQQTGTMPLPQLSRAKQAVRKVRIGRPAYQVFKSRDPETEQRCLTFELQYPEIEADIQPRHRFMSAFEQRIDSPPDRRYQYLLIAADPYETVAFKIPNEPIDKGEGRFVTHWDTESKTFTLTLYFVDDAKQLAK
jgi:splicing factor 3A subunit 2